MKSLFTLVIALFLVAPVHAETDVSSRGTSRVLPSGTTVSSGRTGANVATSRGARNATTNVARRTTTDRTVAQNPGVVARVGTQTVAVTESGSSTRIGSRSSNGIARAPSISVSSSTTTISKPSVQETISTMESVAELSDHCKAQYMACMDNFCNVLDDNQGRCTCSKNIRNYEKTEEALKTATEELQEVAQKIQYIGLTAEEITTLFTQTEAELAMQNNSDSTKLKNDLDRIKNMIVGVKSGSASSIGDTAGISLDLSNLLSFNIDSTGFDLTSLFTTTTNNNTAAITNQRGEALYKSAAARCKAAVLNSCASQGVEIGVIVNYYDMEIDKQCIQYERALTDANDQMVATVRNAKTVLQKARLMVAQQKNQYDLRGCISALDSCMQDDYVCGTDYEDCLDPTGKYIVEGEVVVGSMPGMSGGSWGTGTTAAVSADKGLYTTWNHSSQNIWSPSSSNTYTIQQYIKENVSLENAKSGTTSSEMAIYLQNKMGYHDDATGRNYGMCISVLNKCQDYTYSGGKYTPADSAVISGWMERALRQIKISQDTVLSKYAQSCISDVTSCLSQNNYSFYSSSTTTSSNPSNMAIKACLPTINTCRSVTLGLGEGSVTVDSLTDIYKWLDAAISTLYQQEATCNGITGASWSGSTCNCPSATPNWKQTSTTTNGTTTTTWTCAGN